MSPRAFDTWYDDYPDIHEKFHFRILAKARVERHCEARARPAAGQPYVESTIGVCSRRVHFRVTSATSDNLRKAVEHLCETYGVRKPYGAGESLTVLLMSDKTSNGDRA